MSNGLQLDCYVLIPNLYLNLSLKLRHQKEVVEYCIDRSSQENCHGKCEDWELERKTLPYLSMPSSNMGLKIYLNYVTMS